MVTAALCLAALGGQGRSVSLLRDLCSHELHIVTVLLSLSHRLCFHLVEHKEQRSRKSTQGRPKPFHLSCWDLSDC